MTRPTTSARLLLTALASCAFVRVAWAQTAPKPDSLPVRAGTWAAEGGLGFGPGFGSFGGSTADVGVLRFVGARSAVTLNLAGAYGSQTSDAAAQFPSGTTRSLAVSANLGVRRYGRVRRSLAGFGGAGATLGYNRYSTEGGSALTRTRAGGYGELGAAYVVAQRLAVNASTGLLITRLGGQTESVTGVGFDGELTRVISDVRGWEVAAGGVRLSATLFF